MDQEFEDIFQDPTQDDGLDGTTGLPVSSPTRSEQEAELPVDDDKLGHMCIVLSPQVRRQLMRGEPLIVGTSTASVEAFFHRLISVCQMGAHMPVMFQTLGGAVTVANLKKRKNGIISKAAPDRYPVPMPVNAYPMPRRAHGKRKRNTAAETETTSLEESDGPVAATEPETETNAEPEPVASDSKSKKDSLGRDEIPLEAIRLYIKEQRYFPGWNPNAKRNLRKRCKDFELSADDILMYKTKRGTMLPCVEDKAQRMSLIWEAHVLDHRRRDGLLGVLKDKYYWKGMFNDINAVLDSCTVCAQARENNQHRLCPPKDTNDPVFAGLAANNQEAPAAPNGKRQKIGEAGAETTEELPLMEPSTLAMEKYPETSEVHLLILNQEQLDTYQL